MVTLDFNTPRYEVVFPRTDRAVSFWKTVLCT